MSQQYPDMNNTGVGGSQETIELRKKLNRMLRRWPWFIASILLFLAVSFLYLFYADPSYKAKASLMIKDEKKGADILSNPALKGVGIWESAKLVENEIEILRSYDLMEYVVDTLQLFVSLTNIGNIKNYPVYGNDVPFHIEIINPGDIYREREWDIIDTISGLLFRGEEDKEWKILNYGQVYSSGEIKFRCMPNVTTPFKVGDKILNLTKKYKVEIDTPEEAILRYNKILEVEAASKLATVITLAIKDNNKKRATKILENLIDLYNYKATENRNRVTDITIDFLSERLNAVVGSLKGVEGTVEKLKSRNMVTDLSADAKQYLANSQQVDAQKVENQTQLNIINALERNLQLSQDNPQLVPTTFGIQDPSLGLLIEKHNELVLQKERIQEKSGPKNPLLIDQQNQISELRSRLLNNVRNLKQAYTISLEDISQKDAQLNSRIRNVPQLEKKLLEITRNQNVQEQLYSFLLLKREEAAVTRASDIQDSHTIIQPRSVKAGSFKIYMVLMLGIVMGFLIPFGFFSWIDFFDNKVGDIDQVQQLSGLPVLGFISHIRKIKTPIVVNAHSRSAVSEQIRNIRAGIAFTGNGRVVKSILVTSFNVSDGKSFISLNLAAGFALLNKRTVILEFDLRRPRLAKDLGIQPKDGITTLLSGNALSDDLFEEVQGFDGKLFLLPSGPLAPNPAELISGARMKCLIDRLQQKFDYIIIDSPPIGLVADASLLQQFADISLFVLRQGYTSKDVYQVLKDRAISFPERPNYVILNDVGKRKRYRGAYGNDQYGKGYYFEEKVKS